jgi:hypothetical protein
MSADLAAHMATPRNTTTSPSSTAVSTSDALEANKRSRIVRLWNFLRPFKSKSTLSQGFLLRERLPRVFCLDEKSFRSYQQLIRPGNQNDERIRTSFNTVASNPAHICRIARERSRRSQLPFVERVRFFFAKNLGANGSKNEATNCRVKIFDCGSNAARYLSMASNEGQCNLDIARFPSDHGTTPHSMEVLFKEACEIMDFVRSGIDAMAIVICGNENHMESLMYILSVEHLENGELISKHKLKGIGSSLALEEPVPQNLSNSRIDLTISTKTRQEQALRLFQLFKRSSKREFYPGFKLRSILVECNYSR